MVEWKFLGRRDNGTRGREYRLGRDIQGDARRKEIFGGREWCRFVENTIKEKEHDNVKKNVEVPSNDDNDIYAWAFLGVVIIHILLAYYLIR